MARAVARRRRRRGDPVHVVIADPQLADHVLRLRPVRVLDPRRWSAWPTSTSIARFAPRCSLAARSTSSSSATSSTAASSPPGWRTTTPADDASSASSAGRVWTQPRIARPRTPPRSPPPPTPPTAPYTATTTSATPTPRSTSRRWSNATRRGSEAAITSRTAPSTSSPNRRRRCSLGASGFARRAWAHVRALRDETDVRPRVLVTHIPLPRETYSDGTCGPRRVGPIITPRLKTTKAGNGETATSYQDYLTDAAADELLSATRPVMILSGHDHDHCDTARGASTEHTLGAFGWLMGNPRPSFGMLTLRGGEKEGRDAGCDEKDGDAPTNPARIAAFDTCALPRYLLVVRGYGFLGVASVAWLLAWPSLRVASGYMRESRVAFARAFGVDRPRAPLVAAAWRHRTVPRPPLRGGLHARRDDARGPTRRVTRRRVTRRRVTRAKRHECVDYLIPSLDAYFRHPSRVDVLSGRRSLSTFAPVLSHSRPPARPPLPRRRLRRSAGGAALVFESGSARRARRLGPRSPPGVSACRPRHRIDRFVRSSRSRVR